MTTGLILYGPPASGKDTVTKELISADKQYTHFRRLKVGTGRTVGYRTTAIPELMDMRQRGDLLYENERYSSTYAVDRGELDSITQQGKIPIVHLGQVSGIIAVTSGYPIRWVTVGLWCNRDQAERRLIERRDSDIHERLIAWDVTQEDLRSADFELFTLTLNTSVIAATDAAKIVDSCVRQVS